MKKQLLLITTLLLLLSTCSFANTINITVNDEAVEFNESMGFPFINEQNRTMVPFRVILEEFGATVSWDNDTKTGLATKNGIEVKIPIGENYILKNNEKIMNDTNSVIKDNRTYLPIRIVIESLNGRAEWISESKTVALYTEQLTAEEEADIITETPAVPAGDMTVGFMYFGPIGHGGDTYAHDQGRLYLEEKLGVKTIVQESVPEGPEVEKVIASMVDQGANVIFATSFGYMDYVKKMSKQFPDVKFLHCNGYESTDNMANYFGRMEEPRYLSGVVAGMKTKSNKLGYVAAFEIPEVVRGINAFTLGAQSVNPDVTVEVVWTHTWYDPDKEKEAAIILLNKGVDVIAQHQDTVGPQQAAEERGVWSVGYNSDMSSKAPKAYMTAPVWNWGPYYVDQVQKAMDGTWKSENYWGDMKDGVVELAPLTANAPEGAQAKVDELTAKIEDGSLNVFQGPIMDQEGKERIATGAAVSDEEQLEMDWFVKGVVGKVYE